MKALVCTKPGLFEYKDFSKPLLKDGHALLKIKRIGVCGTDLHAFEGTQPYFNYPRILGHELAAEIEAINGSSDFSIGEQVTIIPYFNCGNCVACNNGKPNCCVSLKVCGVHIDGGMCEYLSVPISSLVHANGLSLDELALAEPLAIGAHGIRRADVQQRENVLIIGAGPIGLAAMSFAKIAGAKVIAIDLNDRRLAFCEQQKIADITINPIKEEATKIIADFTNNEMPTVVIDATGSLKAINDAFQYIAHGGRYVLVGLQKGDISFSHPEFHKREATLMSSRNATRADFNHVLENIKNGKIDVSKFITHRTGFENVKDEFPLWLDPQSAVIKAMIEMY